jgi:tRNA threonylcarbamoyladenosine biosynthesis protein TsaE
VDRAAARRRFSIVAGSAEETRALGAGLGEVARPLPEGGLLIALRGTLGAGKTVFVQGLARGLGVSATAEVVSPTFTVARDYPAAGDPPLVLQHLDAYRLGSADDLEAVGFQEMVGDGRVTCVEWADRVEAALPEDRIDLELALSPEDAAADRRELRFAATGPASAAALARFVHRVGAESRR